MNEKFSIFYLLHDLVPIVVILGVFCIYTCLVIQAYDEKHKNLTNKERKISFAGFIVGGLLMVTPDITGKILFNYFPAESFCKFENGRDQRLHASCVFTVKIGKLIQHRSEGK